MSYDLEILDIEGYDGKEIWNSHLKQKQGGRQISIIFPGLRYNVDMPLLYYSTGVLLEAGYSVLSVDTRYSHKREFMDASSEERSKWMFADAKAVLEAIIQLEGYELAVLVGKSLGTIQMSYLTQNYDSVRKCKIVWLTPLLRQNWVVEQMTAHKGGSLIVIGTSDPHYDDKTLGEILDKNKGKLVTIINGNHSLDVPAGLLESMKQLTNVISEMRNFVRG